MVLFRVFLTLLLLAETQNLERPYTDFDLVIDCLKKSGQWVETGKETYAFHPDAQQNAAWRPCRRGHWLYTDYGWTWEGSEPGAWATGHYGCWKKSRDQAWIWVPDAQWLPATVEWLQSGDYFGWRSCQLDRFSNPVEPESERYADPAQWNFIRKEKLKGSLKPEDFADDAKTEALLKNALPVDHVFVTYREIPRPGPAPEVLGTKPAPKPPTIRELPDPDSKPADASPADYFVFRPKFYQDSDGIQRRVHLFLHPRAKSDNEQKIKDTVGDRRTPEEKQQETEKAEHQLERERKHMDDLYR